MDTVDQNATPEEKEATTASASDKMKAALAAKNKSPSEVARATRDKETYPTVADTVTAEKDPTAEAAKTAMESSVKDNLYRLPSGCTRYVTKKGKVILAPGCVITDWDEADEPEFEENVKAGLWRKVGRESLSEVVDRQKNSSIIAKGTNR